MANTEVKELLDAGVHFGHLTRKWNPNMAPYIYMESCLLYTSPSPRDS